MTWNEISEEEWKKLDPKAQAKILDEQTDMRVSWNKYIAEKGLELQMLDTRSRLKLQGVWASGYRRGKEWQTE